MNQLLKATILALCVAATSGCKEEYYVFGDSITSPSNSWVNIVNHWHTHRPDAGFPYLKNGAVAGTTLAGFDFPDHLRQARKFNGELLNTRGVILAYGTNDAGSGVPLDVFEQKLIDVMAQAEDSHLTVTCILPYLIDSFNIDTRPYRTLEKQHCHEWIDITLDHTDSPDGLHLGPNGQATMAIHVLQKLGELDE